MNLSRGRVSLGSWCDNRLRAALRVTPRHAAFGALLILAGCGGSALDLVAPQGTGTVHAVTTVRRKPDAGGDYNVSLIELDEGVRLMSRVEGVVPTAVAIGQRVKARVAQHNGAGLVVFDLLECQA